MIRDSQLIMSDSQVVTATAVSTNVFLGGAGELLGEDVYFQVKADAAATAAGAATVNFQLQTATDAAFTSPVVLFDSGSIAKTAMTAGAKLVQAGIPVGGLGYYRVNYVVGTGPLTAGSFSAWIGHANVEK